MEMRRYFGRLVEAFSIWTPRLTNLGRTLWLDLLSRPPPGRREWVSSVYPASLSSLPSSPLQALLLVSSSEAPFPRFAFLRVLLFFLAGNFDVVPERETKLSNNPGLQPGEKPNQGACDRETPEESWRFRE